MKNETRMELIKKVAMVGDGDVRNFIVFS